LHTPLADVAVIAQSYFGSTGVASCTGEQPIKGLVDSKKGARMSVGEALSNLVWARVSDLHDVKCRGNWMWPAKLDGEACEMYDACEALCDTLIGLGIAMDGGKDSLSMAATSPSDGVVKAPGQVCISCYATVPDISLTATPDLKRVASVLLLCEPSSKVRRPGYQGRLGGSALAQVFGQLSDDCPDLEDVNAFSQAFRKVQSLLDQRMIMAGHDRSDGGLVSGVLEMCFAGNIGCHLKLESGGKDQSNAALRTLFGEELGFIMQIESDNAESVLDSFKQEGLVCFKIGDVVDNGQILVEVDGVQLISNTVANLRDVWESTSFALEKRQCNEGCVEQERTSLKSRKDPPFTLTYFPEETEKAFDPAYPLSSKPRLACLREEGSNGDREMAAAFSAADFDVWDVTMDDLKNGRIGLDSFRGIAFVGGFSFADVFGSAKGWGAATKFNENVREQFSRFKARNNTFSLGICNGCQLSALLGWVPGTDLVPSEKSQPRFVHNASGRFESRFVTVKIAGNTPAIMLKGMGGSVLGVWVAHGEGQAIFPDTSVLTKVEEKGLAPIRYVDDEGVATERYPFNPNGSVNGIAALCSDDGRHLAFMPHPERCFRKFQIPWMPLEWKRELKASPWMKLFQNARTFCDDIN
jgi:phosphoribosylformylglycinamidine synthase